MVIQRTDIERALDDLISNEEGMRFQDLAVVLAKQRWPDLVACERKLDLGADAKAIASLAAEGRGKVLACSLTGTLEKVRADAKKIKANFKGINVLIFATARGITNQTAEQWAVEVRNEFDYELVVMPRADIITSLMEPSNASLCRSFLGIPVPVDESVADLVENVRAATADLTDTWSRRLGHYPLIELRAVKLDQAGAEHGEFLRLNDIRAALSQSRRIVLEAPAGRGKTTTLIQLAQEHRGSTERAFLIDLPLWTKSRLTLMQFVAGMVPFQARSISAEALARAYQAAHFSFLLNGWNEIGESDSAAALEALKELERTFPSAGVIVSTRAHHIVPPLPGALRTRLLPPSRTERIEYLKKALGAPSGRASLEA